MYAKNLLYILLLGFMPIVSCSDAESSRLSESSMQTAIVGQWDLESAWRNGKSTESLTDAHFVFDLSNRFSTNVFGSDSVQEVIWQDSTFMPLDSSMHYKVVRLENDTLELTFDIQRYNFNIILSRSRPNDALQLFAPSSTKESL